METRPHVAIRHEDKSSWERRAPLAPEHVRRLVEHHGVDVLVQTSPTRIFPDAAYLGAGARIVGDLRDCRTVLGVKEVDPNHFVAGSAYIFFAHVIKGQARNMPMLRTLMERRCQLFDYEKIVDDQNRRLIFFGPHAGMAGMIEVLWTLGQRFRVRGVDTPLEEVRRPYQYDGVAEAKEHLREIGEELKETGIPPELRPFVLGITGYGNVSRGAQLMLDALPVVARTPAQLLAGDFGDAPLERTIFKVVFAEEHMVEPVAPDGHFELRDYYDHPEKYRGIFARYLPLLTALIHCSYWEPRYPRIVTRADVERLWTGAPRHRRLSDPKLQVIGDISCDILGGVEITLRATDVDDPTFVYRPERGTEDADLAADGPAVMSIDHLPCELPADATQAFGDALVDFVPYAARADFSQPFDKLALPPELHRALIVHRGELTPAYGYLAAALAAAR